MERGGKTRRLSDFLQKQNFESNEFWLTFSIMKMTQISCNTSRRGRNNTVLAAVRRGWRGSPAAAPAPSTRRSSRARWRGTSGSPPCRESRLSFRCRTARGLAVPEFVGTDRTREPRVVNLSVSRQGLFYYSLLSRLEAGTEDDKNYVDTHRNIAGATARCSETKG